MLFEGVPDYPEPDRLWSLVERHRITIMGLSPTAARATAVGYLTELATRYVTDRQAEAGARLGDVGAWLLPVVADAVRPTVR